MQRHADGCGDLWNKQTGGNNSEASTTSGGGGGGAISSTAVSNGDGGGDKKKSTTLKMKPNEWVVIPVFADIVCLALTAREDCLTK